MKISMKKLVDQIESETGIICAGSGRRIDLFRRADSVSCGIIFISFDRTTARHTRAGIDRVFSSVPDLIDHLKKVADGLQQ